MSSADIVKGDENVKGYKNRAHNFTSEFNKCQLDKMTRLNRMNKFIILCISFVIKQFNAIVFNY